MIDSWMEWVWAVRKSSYMLVHFGKESWLLAPICHDFRITAAILFPECQPSRFRQFFRKALVCFGLQDADSILYIGISYFI